MTVTYDDLARVVGMQLISVAGDIGLTGRTVTLTFRPVGHLYGATDVTIDLAAYGFTPANPTKPRTELH